LYQSCSVTASSMILLPAVAAYVALVTLLGGRELATLKAAVTRGRDT